MCQGANDSPQQCQHDSLAGKEDTAEPLASLCLHAGKIRLFCSEQVSFFFPSVAASKLILTFTSVIDGMFVSLQYTSIPNPQCSKGRRGLKEGGNQVWGGALMSGTGAVRTRGVRDMSLSATRRCHANQEEDPSQESNGPAPRSRTSQPLGL